MDPVMKEKKRELFRQQILNDAKKYIDGEGFDGRAFFKDNPYYANKMQSYFGGMTKFYKLLGTYPKSRRNMRTVVGTIKKKTVRNMLAYERLDQLREKGLTYEEIGVKYGVSKQAIESLFTMLTVALNEEN